MAPAFLKGAVRAMAGLGLGLTMSWSAAAEPGVSDDTILFGQSAAFEGPAAALGTGMREGLLAAFAEANAAGGVKGRKIDLVSYDDGYEPEAAITNTNKLIDEDKVFALIGEVGTPTSKAVQPIATDAQVPFVGPFTGAGFLRDASLGNVVNVRGSYDQETEAWIRHLTEDLNYDKIAILYQDDSYGRAGLSGVQKAMEKRDLELVAEGTYTRNTTAVKSALLEIRKADPQAVVMVGAYAPSAEFIRLGKKVGLNATYVNISFVGSKALASELGEDGAGVVITQVVPFPWDDSIPVVAEYQEALKAHAEGSEVGFVSLEGYIVGRLAIAALENVEGDLTREGFLQAVAQTGTFDLGGITLTYGPDDNQGMDEVFLTEIQAGGSFKAVEHLSKGGS
ncbi:ABC transporter substrate-binding protein [Fodinicurvata halophila]|uniref:ABC transporter substrate-binding protein n=1 Tax=Fodinicurvata halophila TaxID=1419723 RepID=A0ABV8UQF9_9PROT